ERLKNFSPFIWEWLLIIAWAVWIGRNYLDPNPRVWPWGAEFPMVVLPNYIWTILTRCGDCVFWNGMINGGYPAFAELHGAPLHPITILTTLFQGPINGVKTNLILHLALAGFAQWWLARSLNLRLVPRLWSACMAVAGGHLAGRMELGLFPLVMSTASASLVLAAGLDLVVKKNNRAVVGLGLCLALLLLSGQGYLQIGTLVTFLPAFLIFLVDNRFRFNALTGKFILAGLLAVLLSATFLLPFLRFYPQFVKDIDPYFSSTQPLEYLPINLVIRDEGFFRIQTLGKQPFPYIYANYVGWVAVALALGRLFHLPSSDKRRLYFYFLTALVLVFLAASAISLKTVFSFAPEFLNGIRNPSLIAGLSVPLVLVLAAWALDDLFSQPMPRLSLSWPPDYTLSVNLFWVVIAIPLVWSLKSAHDFSRYWLVTTPAGEGLSIVLQSLRTPSTQWTRMPLGEHFWQPDAAEMGLKLSGVFRPWHWKNRMSPDPYLEGARAEEVKNFPEYTYTVDGVHLLAFPEKEYAFVKTGSRQSACQAEANGGHIRVTCENNPAGQLMVMENYFSGWVARCNGERLSLDQRSPWLSVWLPAGKNECQFNYRPWDVYTGIALNLLGVVLAVYLWRKAERPLPPD
ncbi:MAG: hypothetical protein ACOYXO_02265, partial [Chloroflexota bacterium]